MVVIAPAVAASLISGGTSLLGGIFGAGARNRAAEEEADIRNEQARQARQFANQNLRTERQQLKEGIKIQRQ